MESSSGTDRSSGNKRGKSQESRLGEWRAAWKRWRGRRAAAASRRRASLVGFFRFYGNRLRELGQIMGEGWRRPLADSRKGHAWRRTAVFAAWLAVTVGAVGLATRLGFPSGGRSLWPAPVLPTRPAPPQLAELPSQLPELKEMPGSKEIQEGASATREPVAPRPEGGPGSKPATHDERVPAASDVALGEEVTVPAGAEQALPAPGPASVPMEEPADSTGQAAAPAPAGMVWPVAGEIVRGFGWRRDPLLQQWRYVAGVMLLPTEQDSAVKAALDGKVAAVEGSPAIGYTVRLAHAGGWESRYEGLTAVSVKVGNPVARGERLGELLPPAEGESDAVMAIAGGEESGAEEAENISYLPGGATPVPGALPADDASPAAIVRAQSPPAGSALLFSLYKGTDAVDPTAIVK